MPARLTATLALLAAILLSPAALAAPQLSDVAGKYAISQRGSSIRFAIGQIDGGGMQGRFGNFSGSISIDKADISRSGVSLVIVPGSVTTGQKRVDAFLRSNAVFDAENENRIVFRSTAVRRQGDATAIVQGRLTARGKTANETFNVTLESFSGRAAVFHVTGKVLRSRYGMDVGTPIYSNVVDFDMRFEARR